MGEGNNNSTYIVTPQMREKIGWENDIPVDYKFSFHEPSSNSDVYFHKSIFTSCIFESGYDFDSMHRCADCGKHINLHKTFID